MNDVSLNFKRSMKKYLWTVIQAKRPLKLFVWITFNQKMVKPCFIPRFKSPSYTSLPFILFSRKISIYVRKLNGKKMFKVERQIIFYLFFYFLSMLFPKINFPFFRYKYNTGFLFYHHLFFQCLYSALSMILFCFSYFRLFCIIKVWLFLQVE